MTFLDPVAASWLTQFLGLALFHSLWQGIVIAILLKGMLEATRRAAPNARYLASCTALMLVLLLPALTAAWAGHLQTQSPHGAAVPFRGASAAGAAKKETEQAFAALAPGSPLRDPGSVIDEGLMRWAVYAWLIGVMVSSLRLCGVWVRTRRLRQAAKDSVGGEWHDTLTRLCGRLRVSRPVRLLRSSMVHAPTVIGWVRPVILVPPSAFAGMTPQQLELILAHELAHIRRHDYLVNLLQTVIETLLFYHPAVWWISLQIRAERENACDDAAVRVGSDPAVYARALIAMERLRSSPTLAVAADGGSLTKRVRRLIGADAARSSHLAGVWVIAVVGLVSLTLGTMQYDASSALSEIIDVAPAGEAPKDTAPLSGAHVRSTDGPAVRMDTPRTNIDARPPRGGIEVAATEEVNNPAAAATPPAEAGTPNVDSPPRDGSGDFIDEMASVGYTNLSIGELVRLREADVTADYVRKLRRAGYEHLSVKQLAQLGLFGVTPAYIAMMRSAGHSDLTPAELVRMRAEGVTPEQVKKGRKGPPFSRPADPVQGDDPEDRER